MAPDSITAPWYGMVGWLGDVVYKYKYDESELEWNVSPFEKRTCTRLAVGATLASANSRFTENTAGQGSQPACTTNTNYGEKGKGRREEQIQGLCSACGVYAPLKKCISSSTSSALCLHYLDAELGCTPHHSEPAGTAANHEKVKRFLYSSHFGFRIVQNNVPKNLIRF